MWAVVPEEPGDFNVPAPLVHGPGFILVSENNGARLYAPRDNNDARFEAVHVNRVLSPNAHSPVISGDCLLGIDNGLHCLSLKDDLKSKWKLKDRAFRNYGTLIASPERALAITFKEELVLINPHRAKPLILSRLKLSEDGTDCWTHPALVSGSLFLRLGQTICRLDLPKA